MKKTTCRWVVCQTGKGRLHENSTVSKRTRHFPENSVGLFIEDIGAEAKVWLIGRDEYWNIRHGDFVDLDVQKTGDKFSDKICNICHCLKPVAKFARNQNNKHGILRRPSCIVCRSDIDKRPPKSGQAKRMEKQRPAVGDAFKCPICQKRSIAGITAKVVADHDHNTGNIRDFICDSCNTGLGRFKNGENYLMNAVQYLKERDALK